MDDAQTKHRGISSVAAHIMLDLIACNLIRIAKFRTA
jgi:hypothetical protein